MLILYLYMSLHILFCKTSEALDILRFKILSQFTSNILKSSLPWYHSVPSEIGTSPDSGGSPVSIHV